MTHLNSLKSPQIASHLIVFQGALFGCWRGWRSFENSAANGGRKVIVASYQRPLLKWLFFVQLLIGLQQHCNASPLSKAGIIRANKLKPSHLGYIPRNDGECLTRFAAISSTDFNAFQALKTSTNLRL